MCELTSLKICTLDKNETDLWFELFYKKVINPLPFTRPRFNYVGFVYDDGTDPFEAFQRLIFIQGRSESLFCYFLGGREYHLLSYFLF